MFYIKKNCVLSYLSEKFEPAIHRGFDYFRDPKAKIKK